MSTIAPDLIRLWTTDFQLIQLIRPEDCVAAPAPDGDQAQLTLDIAHPAARWMGSRTPYAVLSIDSEIRGRWSGVLTEWRMCKQPTGRVVLESDWTDIHLPPATLARIWPDDA